MARPTLDRGRKREVGMGAQEMRGWENLDPEADARQLKLFKGGLGR